MSYTGMYKNAANNNAYQCNRYTFYRVSVTQRSSRWIHSLWYLVQYQRVNTLYKHNTICARRGKMSNFFLKSNKNENFKLIPTQRLLWHFLKVVIIIMVFKDLKLNFRWHLEWKINIVWRQFTLYELLLYLRITHVSLVISSHRYLIGDF